MSTESREYLHQLRYLLEQYCRPAEIRQLCSDLNVDYESLPNGTLLLKLNGLIRQCAQQGRLEELTGLLLTRKPGVEWPVVPSAEQQIADQRLLAGQGQGEEATLQHFLDELQGLLRAGKPDDKVIGDQLVDYLSRTVVDTLHQLGPQRKAELLRTLYDANLIVGHSPAIRLAGADLSRIDLGWQRLPEINLCGADLRESDLSLCNLRGAYLARADLRQAIVKALLADADLAGADLREAQLSRAKLSGAQLTGANLQAADLSGADLSHVDLKGSDLTRANLSEANLTAADLSSARLDNANLTATDLHASTLDQANMNGASVDQEQLDQASSMKGVIFGPERSHAFG